MTFHEMFTQYYITAKTKLHTSAVYVQSLRGISVIQINCQPCAQCKEPDLKPLSFSIIEK